MSIEYLSFTPVGDRKSKGLVAAMSYTIRSGGGRIHFISSGQNIGIHLEEDSVIIEHISHPQGESLRDEGPGLERAAQAAKRLYPNREILTFNDFERYQR